MAFSSLTSPQVEVKSTLRDWKPINARQAEALSRQEFEIGIGGERGGGKSDVGRVWLLEPEYLYHPMYRALILRKNSVDLEDWIFKMRAFSGLEISGNPRTIKFPGGGIGTLGHLANKDAYSHYVGHEYQKILFEELNLIPEEKQYLMILGSCRSSIPELRPQTMNSANPGNVGHFWYKKRFIDTADGKAYIDPKSGLSRIMIRLKLRENTKLPKEYEQTLKLLPDAIQKAWLEGDWDALAGLFFTSLPEVIQPRPINPSDLNLYGSFDFGSSEKGHSSFGMWHLNEDGIPERIFTWYHKLGHTAGEQARELFDYVRSFPFTDGRMPKKVFADPAIFPKRKEVDAGVEPKSVADYFSAVGFNMVPANNNRPNGWIVMQDFFGRDPITKEPRCRVWDGYNGTLFECLEIQVRDENNPMDIAPNDLDHVVDECRYGLTAFHSMRGSSIEAKKREPARNVDFQLAMMNRRGMIGETGL